MKRSSLTDCEVAIMRVLWSQGQATATEILQGLDGRWSNSALRTFLRILERKGHIRHDKRSRSFVYVPLTTYDQALQNALDALTHHFFDDSAQGLRQWLDKTPSPVDGRRPRTGTEKPRAKVKKPSQQTRFEETWLL